MRKVNWINRCLLAALTATALSPLTAQAQSLSRPDMLAQMSRTIDYLQARQLPDKQWSGAFISDVTQDGMLLIAGKRIGLLTETRQRQLLSNILNRIEASRNGWSAYPGGPIDMNVTSFTLNVLRVFGYGPNYPLVANAWTYYQAHGADESLSTPFKLYLISLGLKDPDSIFLPTPHELVTAPTYVYMEKFGIVGDMFYPYIGLRILRGLPDGAWRENAMSVNQYLAQPIHIGPGAKPESVEEAMNLPTHDVKLVRQIIALTLRSRGINSSWYGTCFAAFNMLLFKEAQRVGMGDFSAVLQKSWNESQTWDVPSEDGSHGVEPMRSDIWDTAAVLTALSFVPQELQPRVSRLQPQKSVKWLIDHRNSANGKIRSLWSFDSTDTARPDSDDTGAVLYALSRYKQVAPQQIQSIIASGIGEIQRLQNSDGGFAAWSRGVSSTIFWVMQKMIGFPEMADISQSDITARLVHIFDEFKKDGLVNPAATSIVQGQICEFFKKNGQTYSNIPVKTFVGHWFSNYVYASSQLIIGLRSAHCANNEQWIADLSKWILSVQQADGGWGEDNASYVQKRYVQGRTTLAQTSLAIAGLIDAYEVLEVSQPALAAQVADSIERGLRFCELRTNQSTVFFEPDFTAILIKGLQYSRYELLPAYIGLYNYARWYKIKYNQN